MCLVNIAQLVPSGWRCRTSAAKVIGLAGWSMGVDMDEDIVDNVEGVGEDPGRVAIEDADMDGDADVDTDGEDEWALVVVEDMGVEDGDCEHEHEWAGVAVDAEA